LLADVAMEETAIGCFSGIPAGIVQDDRYSDGDWKQRD
jgi:hypothetical protein